MTSVLLSQGANGVSCAQRCLTMFTHAAYLVITDNNQIASVVDCNNREFLLDRGLQSIMTIVDSIWWLNKGLQPIIIYSIILLKCYSCREQARGWTIVELEPGRAITITSKDNFHCWEVPANLPSSITIEHSKHMNLSVSQCLSNKMSLHINEEPETVMKHS